MFFQPYIQLIFNIVNFQVSLMTNLILVGDRVLIKPGEPNQQTTSGLYLPASVKQKERIQGGQVVNVGPGYLMPNPDFDDEPWSASQPAVRFLPLQAQVGDYAFFLRKEAIDLEYEDETYLIIPHQAILALVRKQPDERDLYG